MHKQHLLDMAEAVSMLVDFGEDYRSACFSPTPEKRLESALSGIAAQRLLGWIQLTSRENGKCTLSNLQVAACVFAFGKAYASAATRRFDEHGKLRVLIQQLLAILTGKAATRNDVKEALPPHCKW